MAKREMPNPATNISDQEWNSIQSVPTRIDNEVEQTLDQPAQVTQSVVGIVTNCKKLNLRTKPSKAAPVIYEMPADSKLTIDFDRSIHGWLCVHTESGLEGFCMKEYVSIK